MINISKITIQKTLACITLICVFLICQNCGTSFNTLEFSSCIPGERLKVSSLSDSTNTTKYVDVVSYSGEYNARQNYDYFSYSVNPIHGPEPVDGKINIFFYKDSRGLNFSFYAHVDQGGVVGEHKYINIDIEINGNSLKDEVIISDDECELKEVIMSSDDDKNYHYCKFKKINGFLKPGDPAPAPAPDDDDDKPEFKKVSQNFIKGQSSFYEGRFDYTSNTDGGVIGPIGVDDKFEIVVKFLKDITDKNGKAIGKNGNVITETRFFSASGENFILKNEENGAIESFNIVYDGYSDCDESGSNSAPSKDDPINVVVALGDYIEVPEYQPKDDDDNLHPVPAFSVMKYEAKRDTSAGGVGTAVSKEDGKPWQSVRREDAIERCKLLNSEVSNGGIDNDVNEDGTYALISNSEWMSLARNIENVPANWTSGIVGTGCLFRGNVGAELPCEGPEGPAGSEVNSGYNHDRQPDYGSNRSSTEKLTAKLTLSNGAEIWDLSGNLLERTDHPFRKEKRPYVSGDGDPNVCNTHDKNCHPNSCDSNDNSDNSDNSVCDPKRLEWRDFKDLDENKNIIDKMPYLWAPSNLNLDEDLNKDYGFGGYWRGNNNHPFYDASRGGAFNINDPKSAGIFTLMFVENTPSSGFRCVYRPPSEEPESGSESQ